MAKQQMREHAEECAEKILYKFRSAGTEIQEESCNSLKKKYSDLNWRTGIFTSQNFRRAHLDVIDATESHKLWILHSTVFPHFHDNSPIFGFDLIVGPTRISGAFHDFSPNGSSSHEMSKWFSLRTENLVWKKTRELPEWAQKIFSPSMIAAGAITDEKEAKQFLNVGLQNLAYYLNMVGKTEGEKSFFSQRFYCENQRKNPHTPRTMNLLGMSEDDAKFFLEEVLFPLPEEEEN